MMAGTMLRISLYSIIGKTSNYTVLRYVEN